MNYYNDIDQNACAWIKELISQKLIPAGDVDHRSILEISPNDLKGYTQCHFFAGIGGWSLALELAGVDSARPLWTGSCPCQPYSTAGKGLGDDDPRNLWPAFFKLIRECRPVAVFGEQVADAIGKGWLDGVSANLEGEGYACGAIVLGAHSVRAPHIRKRLYWVADSHREGHRHERHSEAGIRQSVGESSSCRMADGVSAGLQGHPGHGDDGHQPGRFDSHAFGSTGEGGPTGGMGLTNSDGRKSGDETASPARYGDTTLAASFWSDSYWLLCRDGKHRRVPTEPALFPLADGLPYKLARRGSIRPALLKGAGNAIVPVVAAEFITAFMETNNDHHPQDPQERSHRRLHPPSRPPLRNDRDGCPA